MEHLEHVLVIDDDPALLEQTEQALCSNYQVSLANSGRQAIEYLKRNACIDLILLDIQMPQMDGYETLRQIRLITQYAETPIIFLTGLTDTQSELQGLTVGAVDYITKPFDSQVLLARVELRLCTGMQLDEKKLESLPHPLTNSELNVARLLARSYSNQEIAEELHYALDSVKKLVSHILEKLDIHSRKEIRKFFKIR